LGRLGLECGRDLAAEEVTEPVETLVDRSVRFCGQVLSLGDRVDDQAAAPILVRDRECARCLQHMLDSAPPISCRGELLRNPTLNASGTFQEDFLGFVATNGPVEMPFIAMYCNDDHLLESERVVMNLGPLKPEYLGTPPA
jgi:hypothetical protein